MTCVRALLRCVLTGCVAWSLEAENPGLVRRWSRFRRRVRAWRCGQCGGRFFRDRRNVPPTRVFVPVCPTCRRQAPGWPVEPWLAHRYPGRPVYREEFPS